VLRLPVAGGQASDQLSLFFEHRSSLPDPVVSAAMRYINNM
jgi:hypothetical protein